MLDCAILAHYMKQRELPQNLPNLTEPGVERFTLESGDLDPAGATVLKIAVGMGGHNSIVSLRSPASQS